MNETVAALYRERAAEQQKTVDAYPVGTRFVDKSGTVVTVARIDGMVFYFDTHQWDAVADEDGIVRRANQVTVSAYEVAEMIESGSMKVAE